MSHSCWQNAWDSVISMPLSTRIQKPRNYGLTMVMDKGLGLNETSELLSVAGNYIDYVKLAFGTPALYNGELLRKKISLVRTHGIHIYPGGTFLEIAVMQNKTDDFLKRAWELGFRTIEVSDGTIPISAETRRKTIKTAIETGFEVISEVGKKDPSQNIPVDKIVDQINLDLEAGAYKVILEARESGKGIGIFNNQGEIRRSYFAELLAKMPECKHIIWEAPLKNQQLDLILTFDPNVNLGNIPPGEVLALESLRLGLRGDTLKTAVKQTSIGA